MYRDALLYKKLSDSRAQCLLCAHRCVIVAGGKGICQVRENRNGQLVTLVYGRSISRNVDPIEKKPLNHFYPGSRSFSIATPGCNLRCTWCQNWEISQMPCQQHLLAGHELPPQDVVSQARETGCRSIAYTYTEPTIFFEYSYDTARLAREAGLANVYVSNGYMSPEMLELFHPWLDAANIDLKAFRDETYRMYAGGRLQPVLDNLKRIRAYGVWLEVTTLLIPGVNDDPQELRDLADFISCELGAETPWHISRFFPQFKMTTTPLTSPETLIRAAEIGAEAGLKYIYLGNLRARTETCCSSCGALLIVREGFQLVSNRVDSQSRCPDCAALIAGVGMGLP